MIDANDLAGDVRSRASSVAGLPLVGGASHQQPDCAQTLLSDRRGAGSLEQIVGASGQNHSKAQ